jgi:superfamily II helicase
MRLRDTTPDEAALSAPSEDSCDRCGAGPEGDLRLVVFRGRVRYAERTLCDDCAETLLENFIDTAADRI